MATLCCHGLLQQLAVFIVVFTTKVLYYKTLQIRNSWEMGRFHCKLFSFLLSVTLFGLYEHTVLLRNLYITNLLWFKNPMSFTFGIATLVCVFSELFQ